MRIEQIIYDTTRDVSNTDDKLRIATIFIFCQKLGDRKLSELLYSKSHKAFIEQLNNEYQEYDIDLSINFDNINVRQAFKKTLEAVKNKWDDTGYYKAIAKGDKYALVICDITEVNFNDVSKDMFIKNVAKQLSLWDDI